MARQRLRQFVQPLVRAFKRDVGGHANRELFLRRDMAQCEIPPDGPGVPQQPSTHPVFLAESPSRADVERRLRRLQEREGFRFQETAASARAWMNWSIIGGIGFGRPPSMTCSQGASVVPGEAGDPNRALLIPGGRNT